MLRPVFPANSLALVLYSSKVRAGFPSPADDHTDGELDLNELVVRRPAATFYARAEGDSMRDAGIFDGDLLVVDRSLRPDHGDIVVAVLNGCLTVKRVSRSGSRWFLASANPAYPGVPIPEDDECLVWGVVTFSLRQHCAR